MELYLIRHGESFNNVQTDPRQRVCDPPLTDRGRQQAQGVAERLSDVAWAHPAADSEAPRPQLTRLYTSPMLRTLETTEAIRQTTGLTPHVWIDLHEHGGIWLDYGDDRGPVGLPGLNGSEMATRFPHFVLPESIGAAGWWNRPWEDTEAAFARGQRAAQELRSWVGAEERIGLVSHGGSGDSLISALLELPFQPYTRFGQHNTAISRLDLTDQRVQLRFLNRIDHLPKELIS